jgi:hypothetical protein
MILYVVKDATDPDPDPDPDADDESGTEGFDDDDDDYISDYQRQPYCFDYAKIIEEYYHAKLSHTSRRLIIMF